MPRSLRLQLVAASLFASCATSVVAQQVQSIGPVARTAAGVSLAQGTTGPGTGLNHMDVGVRAQGDTNAGPAAWGLQFDPNLAALANLDLDAMSLGLDWVLSNQLGDAVVDPRSWGAINFSVTPGTGGERESVIAMEDASPTGAAADVFTYVLRGSNLPAEFVGRTMRSVNDAEMRVVRPGGGEADIDALDLLAGMMFRGNDRPGALFFSLTTNAAGAAPGNWWNGTLASGATILVTRRANNAWTVPQPYITYAQLGLGVGEDVDAIGLDFLRNRLIFSTTSNNRDSLLFHRVGGNGHVVYRDPTTGTPVSSLIGLRPKNPPGIIDDVDGICLIDPGRRRLPVATPVDSPLVSPSDVSASAFLVPNSSGQDLVVYLTGWPVPTGTPGPGTASVWLSSDPASLGTRIAGPFARNPANPVAGDPIGFTIPITASSSSTPYVIVTADDQNSGARGVAHPLRFRQPFDGTVVRTFPSPAVRVPVGLEHDGNGDLLYTAVGPPVEVGTHDTEGTVSSTNNPTNSAAPLGITTDGVSWYVTDNDQNLGVAKVDVYGAQWVWLRSFSVAAWTGFAEGITYRDVDGDLYVVDGTAGNQCLRFTRSGVFVAAYPLLGTSNDGIAYDSVTDTFWVYDSGTDRCRNYGPDFTELGSFPGTIAAGYAAGEGVAVIGGHLFVVAALSNTIVEFDITGSAALATSQGTGCPNRSSPAWYENFASTTLDLSGTSWRLNPNGSGGFSVAVGPATWNPAFSNNLALTDDSLSRTLQLGFDMRVPGLATETTGSIVACSNGYLYWRPGPGLRADPSTSTAEFLSEPARLAALWADLNPAAGGAVYFDTSPGLALLTFDRVLEYGRPNANSFQVQLHPNGTIDLVYGALAMDNHLTLVGHSDGDGAPDPGSIDLTAQAPFMTSGAIPLRLSTTDRPILGTTMSLVTRGLPRTTLSAAVLVGNFNPALPLDSLGMPGCTMWSTGDLDALPINLVPSPQPLDLPIPNLPAIVGWTTYLQSVAIAPGVNPLGLATSNGLEVTFGSD